MMLLLISIVTVYQKDLQLYIVDKVSITDPHSLTFTNISSGEWFFCTFRSNFTLFIDNNNFSLGVVHKLRWHYFVFFWPPKYPLRWHVLWYERWQKVDIFGPPTYPRLVNVVCEQPLALGCNRSFSRETFIFQEVLL